MEQKKKPVFYTELAYVLGILILAMGPAFMGSADFGVSMVVAPAYLIYLKLSQILPFFTFGMAEYLMQALLLIVLIIVLRKFKLSYLLSFATAVFYGLALDLYMIIIANFPCDTMPKRLLFFFIGMVVCSVGVSLLFHTYISPEVYELVVKELSKKYGFNINKCKTVYDCVSCLIGIIMSFCFFGMWHFEGVKLGTIFCALTNGWLISVCTRVFEHFFEFRDRFKWRSFFEN